MIGFIFKKLERVRERYQIFIWNLLDEQFLYISKHGNLKTTEYT